MRYLIVMPGEEPFMTEWFEYENHFQIGMVIYDFAKMIYSQDGIKWKEIEKL